MYAHINVQIFTEFNFVDKCRSLQIQCPGVCELSFVFSRVERQNGRVYSKLSFSLLTSALI